MTDTELDFTVATIGECGIPSPMKGARFTRDDERVLYHTLLDDMKTWIDRGADPPSMEAAGPRENIDPSYTIRSMPSNPHDSAFCLLLGQSAVHAGMSGRTNMVLSFWNYRFAHVPIRLAVSQRKRVDPLGLLWNSVIASTGQPREMS